MSEVLTDTGDQNRPWYKEPMTLFVMALPLTAVIASCITFWIALTHRDTIVTDDYQREGLGISRSLARDDMAGALNVVADVRIDTALSAVSVRLSGQNGYLANGETPLLRFVHPHNGDLDRIVHLALGTDGLWHGAMAQAIDPDLRWQVMLETPRWRIAVRAPLVAGAALRLAPMNPAE